MVDIVELATQGVFILLAAVTLANYLRHRDQARFDVALLFADFGIIILVGWLREYGGIVPPGWVSLVTAIGLMALPYLTIRLLPHFHPVRPTVHAVALLGLAVSVALLLLYRSPYPDGATAYLVGYFVAAEGYAAWAIVRGAQRHEGATRWRLQLAAAGFGVVALIILLAGIGRAAPSVGPVVAAITPVALPLIAVSWFLGFAPPRWLRRTWHSLELQSFLRLSVQLPPREAAERVPEILSARARGSMGALWAAVARPEEREGLRLLGATPEGDEPLEIPADDPVVGPAARAGRAAASASVDDASAGLRKIAERLGASVMFAVPITSGAGRWGALVVLLRRSPLFAREDLELLDLYCRHAAVLLDNAEHARSQERLAKHLEELNSELVERNRELNQFAYVASHDLQEPLRMVASYVQLLERRYGDKLDRDARDFIGYAVDGTLRMQQLIKDLLAYSRVGTRGKPFVPTDLAEPLERASANLRILIDESQARIVVDGRLPVVNGDSGQLVQLFQNLLSNSIKYRSEAAPEIHISARPDEDRWRISLKDNGIGIDPAHHERIFEIFQRLHTREEYDGTGIGLAICRRIVDRHGGRIWVDSRLGDGATVHFTLPDAQGAAAIAMNRQEAQARAGSDAG